MGKGGARGWLAFGLIVTASILDLAGTDLVLPAIPSLPDALGGTPADAQLVLAAYVAGTCVGLLGFAALGDRFATAALLVVSLLGSALVSFACARTDDMDLLIGLRVLQGAVAAAPAVFAPGIVKQLFDETRAVRAMGLLGSAEALAPAFAPILGLWLLSVGGWRLSFDAIALATLALAVVLGTSRLMPQTTRRSMGGYRRLLGDPVFLRYALSQAFVLGGLLTFVFGMPAVFVRALGGSVDDFIVMQITGIVAFMLAANLVGGLLPRFGAEPVIRFGTLVAAAGAATMLLYGLAGGTDPLRIAALFVPVNAGLGLRGPPGFFRAVMAAQGDDARGSALVILTVLGVTAAGTAIAAPLIEQGLVPLAAIALTLHVAAVLCLAFLPKLREGNRQKVPLA